jgi:ribonuclease E
VAPADVAPADVAPADLAISETTPEIPGFGLLFQAPAPTAAPRRRRATAPAAAPAPEPAHVDHSTSSEAPTQDDQQHGTAEQGTAPERTGAADDSDDSGPDGARHRRRRGGKGRRGRAAGDGGADDSAADLPSSDATSAEDTAETTTTTHPPTDENGPEEDGGSRRRTRRRRRGAAGENDEQPTTTTTRVREPRPQRDEVTAVKGSTRLEAKKQRRREGRESGRRRTVITEAEFLARRESVERVMVVRHKDDRTQIGVLEDGVLVEHYVSREVNASMAGNVYLARVQNVLPSMEAAFADIGRGRNAVLYAGEVNWDAAGLENNRARRIENALSSGQSVLVQVTKDPIGHKGARLTSQISLPGRYLVYVPEGNMMGISRKLPDTERARLKKILREVVPENAGVIVRTAAEGASEDELRADVARLTAAWVDIQKKAKSANAPSLLHGEPDLTVRVIRDIFNEDFASLIVAGEPAWDTVSGYVSTVAPDLADRVQRWTGGQDLFTHYRVDEQIAKAMDRKVWLPSGGSLVIDRTEAMTVIDVNTGKFVGSGGNLEETVTKNNIEAAEEIVRQLRLRDIGGIIVIDFIDMVLEDNRDLVVRRLLECLGRDRTKHQVAEVTSLGLVQMTRKRVGGGLIEVFSVTCEHCNGRGFIISADPVDEAANGNGSGSVSTGGSSGGSGGSGSSSGSGGGANVDAAGGRGSRGRRARESGRDTGVAVITPEPRPTPEGPTPAQIAAAAHAAAIHSASQSEPVSQVDGPSADQVVIEQPAPQVDGPSVGQVIEQPGAQIDGPSVGQVDGPALDSQEPAVQVIEQSADQPPDRLAEVPEIPVAPVAKRRRRSAKSPAVSMEPVVAPLVPLPPLVPSATSAPRSFEPAVTGQGPAPTTEVRQGPQERLEPAASTELSQTPEAPQLTEVPPASPPAAHARRKRARVVAPAGPPPVVESGGQSGEFGS